MKSTESVPTDADDTIDVIALWRLLWGHKVLIGSVAGVFGIVAVILALVTTPVYRAEAVVTPVTDSSLGNAASSLAGRFGGLASLAGIDLGSSGVASHEAQAVLASRHLVEEFIRRNELVDALVTPGEPDAGLWHRRPELPRHSPLDQQGRRRRHDDDRSRVEGSGGCSILGERARGVSRMNS